MELYWSENNEFLVLDVRSLVWYSFFFSKWDITWLLDHRGLQWSHYLPRSLDHISQMAGIFRKYSKALTKYEGPNIYFLPTKNLSKQ